MCALHSLIMNHNVADYLKIINQREVDRWQRWSTYRKTLTDLAINVLLQYPNADVLLIGSGALDDVDLKALQPHCQTLSFLDLDITATQEGIKRQGFESQDFSLIKQDITGYDDLEFFHHWQQFMAQNPSFAETILYIDDKMNQVKQYDMGQLNKRSYDVVMVCPIYTQLIYHEWIELIEHHPSKSWTQNDIIKIKEYLLDLMIPLIDQVNHRIKTWVKKDGKIMAISDLIEWNPSDFQTFKQTHPALSEQDLMEFYLSYVNQFGMGLGDYGLWSLREGLNEQLTRFVLWPFSDERIMLVQIMVITT